MLPIKKINQKHNKTTERNDKLQNPMKCMLETDPDSPQCTLKHIPLPHNNLTIPYSFRRLGRRHDSTSWPWCEFEVEALGEMKWMKRVNKWKK